jgi:hypothetical protein
MKKLLIMTIAVAFLMSGSVLAGGKKMAAYVGGGMAMPMSPDWTSDSYKMGFSGLGSFSFELKPGFELGATFGYNSFDFDEDGFFEAMGFTPEIREAAEALGIDLSVEGSGMTAMEILAFGKYTFGSGEAPFRPYMMGMAGVAMLEADPVILEVTIPGIGSGSGGIMGVDGSDIAVGFGFGFDYMLSPTTGLWFDGRYMMVMTDPESLAYLPVRGGLKFSFGGTGEEP